MKTFGIAIAITAMILTSASHAAFPGGNGRIVFALGGDIWTADPDGMNQSNLTQDPATDFDQRWSPDGMQVVFGSDRNGPFDVWVMDADGGNPTQITFESSEDNQTSWSSDGTRILFTTNRDGNNEVYVVNADGSGQTNLTNNPGDDDDEGHWSPDGTKIAFCRNADIWLMDPDGSNQTNITNQPGSNDFDQNWAPDSTKIVFDSNRDGDQEIFVMDADGSNQTQLTSNGDRDRQPAFSPDGTKIVFESNRSGNDEIWIMDADGQNPVQVTTSGGGEPDWQPIVSVSTTTTTLPGDALAGKKLLLKDKVGDPTKRAIKLLAKDAGVGAGAENGSAGDPVLNGGSLRVTSTAGDGFDTTYDLPASAWRYKGKEGKNKGYKLGQAGPIRTILVKLGKTLKVVAKGDALGHSLGADPNPVHVELVLGSQRYCFAFGGQAKFTPGKKYLAKKAPAPLACGSE